MLTTNQKCHVWAFKGNNRKSQPLYAEMKPEGCNVINARREQVATSVRADSSGSQGRASMQRALFRLQLTTFTVANFGAKIELVNLPDKFYKVIEMQPKFDALGKFHHYQVDLEAL